MAHKLSSLWDYFLSVQEKKSLKVQKHNDPFDQTIISKPTHEKEGKKGGG